MGQFLVLSHLILYCRRLVVPLSLILCGKRSCWTNTLTASSHASKLIFLPSVTIWSSVTIWLALRVLHFDWESWRSYWRLKILVKVWTTLDFSLCFYGVFFCPGAGAEAIFRRVLDWGQFLSQRCKADVTPISNGPISGLFTSYRPISIIPALLKVLKALKHLILVNLWSDK